MMFSEPGFCTVEIGKKNVENCDNKRELKLIEKGEPSNFQVNITNEDFLSLGFPVIVHFKVSLIVTLLKIHSMEILIPNLVAS